MGGFSMRSVSRNLGGAVGGLVGGAGSAVLGSQLLGSGEAGRFQDFLNDNEHAVYGTLANPYGAVASLYGSTLDRSQRDAFAARTRQVQAAEAERARIGENVATARDIYGVGTSTAAIKNKGLIGANLRQKEGNVRDAGLLNLAGQTNEGLRQSNVMGAASGNLGSNFQARQRSILGAASQGRADLAGSIESLRPQQERNLLQQRLGLEKLGSGDLGFNTAQASMDQANALKASQGSILPSALGTLITQGGQMMGQYQQAQSQGQLVQAMGAQQPMTPLAGVNTLDQRDRR